MKFLLAESDLANLALQRTGPLLALGGAEPLRHWFRTGEKHLISRYLTDHGHVEAFVNAVAAEIGHEFESLQPYLSSVADASIVSIGPGYSCFELLLFRALGAKLVLIDIESSPEHVHGFEQAGSGYSSLDSSRRFLEANGVPASAILTCNPTRDPLPSGDFDLLVSIISMGFHYPCDSYVEFIRAGLRKGGLMIIDKRREVPDRGWDLLRADFDVVATIPRGRSDRVILAKH